MQTSPTGSRFQCTCSQIKYNTQLPFPQSRNKLASCLHENFVYIYAGKDGTISLKDFWRFNIGNQTWQQVCFRGDQPSHLEGHTLVSCKKLLLLFGGEFGDSLTESSLWIINPDLGYIRSCSVDPGSEWPSVRRHHSAVVYRGSMFVYGGYVDMKGSSSELWQYRIDDEEWDLLLPRQTAQYIPPGLHGHSAVVFNKYMWVYGGMSNLVPKQDLWCYNFVSLRWDRVKTKYGPPALIGHSAQVVDSQMFIYGGECNREPVSQLWCFCFRTELWTHVTFHQSGPAARMFHSAVVISPQTNADGSVKASSMPYLQNKMKRLQLERPRSSPSSRSQGCLHFSDDHFRDRDSASSRPQVLNLRNCSNSCESLKINPSPAENTKERSPLVPKKTDMNYNDLDKSSVRNHGIDNPGISKSTEELIRENQTLRLWKLNQQNEEMSNNVPFLRSQSQSVGSLSEEQQKHYVRQNSAGFDITDITPSDDLVYKLCAKKFRPDPELIIEDLEYKDCFPYDIKIPYPKSKTALRAVRVLNSSINSDLESMETIELIDMRTSKEADLCYSHKASDYGEVSGNKSSNLASFTSDKPYVNNTRFICHTDNLSRSSPMDYSANLGKVNRRKTSYRVSDGLSNVQNKALNSDIEMKTLDGTDSIISEPENSSSSETNPRDEDMRSCDTNIISQGVGSSIQGNIGAKNAKDSKVFQQDTEPYMLIFGGKEKQATNFGIKPLPVWKCKLKKL